MRGVPDDVAAYHQSGRPLVCEVAVQPWMCEFWPLDELVTYNEEYEVPLYAPGFFGFATSAGGEMFALCPEGRVVCLPFIGMAPGANAFPSNSNKAL